MQRSVAPPRRQYFATVLSFGAAVLVVASLAYVAVVMPLQAERDAAINSGASAREQLVQLHGVLEAERLQHKNLVRELEARHVELEKEFGRQKTSARARSAASEDSLRRELDAVRARLTMQEGIATETASVLQHCETSSTAATNAKLAAVAELDQCKRERDAAADLHQQQLALCEAERNAVQRDLVALSAHLANLQTAQQEMLQQQQQQQRQQEENAFSVPVQQQQQHEPELPHEEAATPQHQEQQALLEPSEQLQLQHDNDNDNNNTERASPLPLRLQQQQQQQVLYLPSEQQPPAN